MKIFLVASIILIIFSEELLSQRYDYWKNAPVEGSKIYSVLFTNQLVGYAHSSGTEIFKSADSGYTWIIIPDESHIVMNESTDILWSADIYCSVMQTTDGGLSWHSYSKEKQAHFCQVYLRDENTGYEIANEFLRNVALKIFDSFSNSKIPSLINYPQQCTEYYTNENEGWAVGWCLKDFKSKNN